MTNNFAKAISLGIFFLVQFSILGQALGQDRVGIKKMTEERLRFTGAGDSVTLHHKTYDYDEQGLLMGKQEFHYNMTPAGSLAKDVNAKYDKKQQLLTENIIVFKNNNEREFENLRTKYLVYAPNEEDSKYIWRQYIDNSLDIVREDTLTYDANQNLIKHCDYNYKGNTSLQCDEYEFDKKNNLRRWRRYTYWTTVKAGGKIVTKGEKKQDYKYKYNGKGQPTKAKGKRYSTQHTELWTYNKQGVLINYRERNYRKVKYTKAGREKTGEKFRIDEEIRERSYNAKGKLLAETYTNQGAIQQQSLFTYENDTLLTSQDLLQKEIKYRRVEFFYDDSKTLTKKLTYNHDSKGIVRFIVQSDYNNKNQLISETQTTSTEVLSRNIFEYNEQGDKISVIMFLKNDKKFEKTLYFYEYY